MQITEEHVKKTAALARLDIGEAEMNRIMRQLQELLDYAVILAEASGSKDNSVPQDILPESDPSFPDSPRLRQEDVLALAPDTSQGMIRVPRVMADD